MLESTEKGGVRNSIQNCLTVFQHDPELSGAVAKNLLTERIDLLKPIGRKRRTGSKAMTDTDMKYIRLYLEKTYGLTSEKKIADAADLAADANSYHPIRDYLNGLVWDGKERIRCCLRHFLGADTDNYTFQSLRLFLLGAIHRAFCPGCKFEVMLCLVGGQGAGKSTFFRLLAVKDEWFSDDLRKLDDDIQCVADMRTQDVKAIREFGKFVPAFAAFEKNRLSLYREAAKEAEEIFDRWADEIDDLDEDFMEDEDYEPDEYYSD